MSLFKNALLEISKKLRNKESYKDDISRIVSSEVGVVVSADNLQTNNGVLFINTSPTIKSAILLKKQEILKRLIDYKIHSIG